MELNKLSAKLLKEIALVALTYRVSYKSLAKIFNTTIKDVSDSFEQLENLRISLYYLDKETEFENEEVSKIAYKKAKEYFKKRTELYKKLKDKNTDKSKVILEIKELLYLIDDSDVKPLMSKKHNELSEEECEKIARFRLKYYHSVRIMPDYFNIGIIKINKIEEQLAAKDPIYSDKLDLLHYVYDQKRKDHI